MTPEIKVPQAMRETYDVIATLTDNFSDQYLDDEYRALLRQAVAALARKKPSPLLTGKAEVWAAGVVHAVGWVNFLDDAQQKPHCKSKFIYEFFGIGASTGQNKSRAIREMLDMDRFTPKWTRQSLLAVNPLVWMVSVNGVVIDIRRAPAALQRQAFELGLIPFVPADTPGSDGKHTPD